MGDDYVKILLVEWEFDWLIPTFADPDKKPSETVQAIMKKRQEEHNHILTTMRNDMINTNAKIEDDIRVASVTYKQRLEHSKKEIADCLQNIRQILKGPAELSAENFSKAIDHIILVYRSNQLHLHNLLQKLWELERLRTSKFKEFLGKAYTKLNQVSYKLPFEIQELFEQEIQAINQTTLNNVRGYSELKINLRLQLKNEIRYCFEEVQYLKENWFYHVKYTLFTNLNRDKLFAKDCNEEALKVDTTAPEAEESFTYTDSTNDPTICVNKMFQWVNKIENVMHHVDECANKIVGTFKQAVINVMGAYFDDMRKVVQTILDQGIIERWEVKAVQAEFCGQAVVDVTGRYTEELTKLQDLWAATKYELQVCLEEAFVFLKNVSDIWSTHFLRVNQIKDIVSQDLKRAMTDGFRLICAEETKLNIKMDTLRQESNHKNLEQGVDSVSKCLDNLSSIYIQNQKNESIILEKISDLISVEAELLESELRYFLHCRYKNTSDININSTIGNIEEENIKNDMVDSSSPETNPAKTLLATEILICKNQIQLLEHWKSGLYMIIDKYMNKCKEESVELAKDWIKTEKFKSMSRLRIVEVLHMPRYDRFEPVISCIRLIELTENNRRLKQHKEGMEQEISNLISIFPKYNKQYTEILDECNSNVEQIRETAISANNSAVLTSEIAHFQIVIKTNIDKIVKVNEMCESDIARRICEIFKCNLLYVKEIKLFSEGGSFDINTSKNFCEELIKMQRMHKSKTASLTQENEKKCSECLQLLGQIKFRMTDFLSKSEGELKHYDNYNYALKDIQTRIKKEMCDIKMQSKKIRCTLNRLWEIGKNSVGQPQKTKQFVEKFEKFMKIVEEFENIFKRPAVVTANNNTSEIQLDHKTSKTTLLGMVEKMQTYITSSPSFGDHLSYLFDSPPENHDSFIGKARYLLYKSYKNVQMEAKNFYEYYPQATIINADKIHDSYQRFIAEVLPEYIYYYLQCELIWLEEANDFLSHIHQILPNLKMLRINSVQQYIKTHHSELEEMFCTSVNELNDIKYRSKEGFAALYKKLMPLHGYPRNKKLLDALNNDVETFLREKHKEYNQPLCLYKENFNEKELKYSVGLVQINDSLKALEISFNSKPYTKHILSEFENTFLQLKKFIAPPQEFDADVAKSLNFYKRNIIIPPEYSLYVNPSLLVCSNSPKDEDCHSETPCYPQDFDITKKIEEFARKKEELLEKINSIVDERKYSINTWKEMWAKSLINVINLYKVKYDPSNN